MTNILIGYAIGLATLIVTLYLAAYLIGPCCYASIGG